jgi:tRNA G10  N-methylase Trm11
MIRLIPGDCRNVLPTLPSESIDLVLTDPPYGIAYRPSRTAGKPAHPWAHMAGDARFDSCFYAAWLRELRRLVREAGFTLKRTLVWHKNAWTMGNGIDQHVMTFANPNGRSTATLSAGAGRRAQLV